jgi:citronellol/citronellal dehydrogenase
MKQLQLKGKVIFITGASRGIGREIALKAAQAGANIVIAAKTAEPQPTLSGTIYTVAEEIRAIGAQALPVVTDVRSEEQIEHALKQAVEQFGAIDILINNASAINMDSTEKINMKRYDLIHSVNTRGTFLCSKLCLPYLKQASNPHILNLAPPLNMQAKWFAQHLAYTMSKYGMSMCTLGLAAEFKSYGIAVNSLWPKTLIATAAIENNFPPELYKASRKPSIVADAAYAILTSDSRELTGNFFVDEDFLRTQGITDFSQYSLFPNTPLFPDLFLD